MPDDTTNERLERLENLVALQDRTIEKLNDALADQQRQMDRMEQQVRTLAATLRRVRDEQQQDAFADVPPPHYNG